MKHNKKFFLKYWLIILAIVVWFVLSSLLVAKDRLARDAMMIWVPLVSAFILFLGLYDYFSQIKSKNSLLKSLAVSVLSSIAILFLFLVFTFDSAWK